jgi:indole-3-glycerol phosphate synthase
MSDFLQKIATTKKQEVRNFKKEQSLSNICANLKCQQPSKYNFFSSLQKSKPALICEAKKGSPSSGLIRQDFIIKNIVQSYEKAGASCISILTDATYFLGSLDFLQQARQHCNLPLLRKDFIIDPYQVYQSKLYNADCILLIVAMLSKQQLLELEQIATDLNMSVLIEVHDELELETALQCRSKLIGINNRNLKTLQVNLHTAVNLAKLVPADRLLVAESGIKTKADIQFFQQHNINCFLIGESLMRQQNIEQAVIDLL